MDFQIVYFVFHYFFTIFHRSSQHPVIYATVAIKIIALPASPKFWQLFLNFRKKLVTPHHLYRDS